MEVVTVRIAQILSSLKEKLEHDVIQEINLHRAKNL